MFCRYAANMEENANNNPHGIQQRGQDFDIYLKGYTVKRLTNDF